MQDASRKRKNNENTYYIHIALSSMIWLIVIWSVSMYSGMYSKHNLKKQKKRIKLQSLRDSNQVVSIYLLNNIINTYIYNCKLIICGVNREREWDRKKWISEMHGWKTLFIDILYCILFNWHWQATFQLWIFN